MEKEVKGQRGCSSNSRVSPETDFLLQWGNRKRLRCAKVKKDQQNNLLANKSDCLGKKKVASRVHVVSPDKISLSPQSHHRVSKISDSLMDRKSSAALSPEKEDRYYTTRGSSSMGVEEKGNGKVLIEEHNLQNIKEDGGGGLVWPKLFLSLSSKEKEQDFMAMKGCKPAQRPKKRAKLIQRSLLLVSPGAWLSDLCQERYEVREKKTSKKKPRGLKAMGSMETDSE